MNLQDLIHTFFSKNLAKPDYIGRMYEFHDILFQFSEVLKKTDIQSIEIRDHNVVFTTRKDGIRIIGIRHDQRIAPIEILNFRAYEPAEFNLAANLIPDNGVIIDIGANIGFFSLSMAKVKSGVSLHAFEPVGPTYEYLVANKKLNGAHNINTYNFGLSNSEEETDFFFYPEGSGNASNRLMDETRKNIRVRCRLRRFDEIFPEIGADRIDFIKCDVEGAELFAFQGGLKTIRQFKPVIFTEMLRKWAKKYDYHPNEIINTLADLGYGCYFISHEKLNRISEVTEDTEATNFFFLQPEHLKLVPAKL